MCRRHGAGATSPTMICRLTPSSFAKGSCVDGGTFIPQIGQNCFLPFFCCHDETLPLNNMLYYNTYPEIEQFHPGKNQPAVCRRCETHMSP